MAMDACDQIRNLIHRYSEAVDQGRFEVLDELFADATVRMAMVIRHTSLDGVHRDFIGDMSRHVRNAPRPDTVSRARLLASARISAAEGTAEKSAREGASSRLVSHPSTACKSASMMSR